jgi:hypothetical protein
MTNCEYLAAKLYKTITDQHVFDSKGVLKKAIPVVVFVSPCTDAELDLPSVGTTQKSRTCSARVSPREVKSGVFQPRQSIGISRERVLGNNLEELENLIDISTSYSHTNCIELLSAHLTTCTLTFATESALLKRVVTASQVACGVILEKERIRDP